jgi:hypothetical protein
VYNRRKAECTEAHRADNHREEADTTTMASGDDKPKSRTPRGRRTRPVKPRTIDLKASEVGGETEDRDKKSKSAAADTTAGETKSTAATQSAKSAAEPAEKSTAGATGRQDEGTAGATIGAKAQQANRASGSETKKNPTDERGTGGTAKAGKAAAAGTASRTGAGPTPVPAPRSGIISGALAGGAAALVVALVLHLTGLLPLTGTDATLRDELAATQARIAALEAAEPAAPDTGGLDDRLDALETRLDAMHAEPPDLSAFEERLAALEAAPGEPQIPEDIEARLAELDDMTARLEGLEANLSDVAAATGADPEIAERLSEVEAAIAAERRAREALAARLDTVTEAMRAADAAADRRIAHAAAGALALSGLTRAVDSGRPYQTELAALRPLVDRPDAIETLSAHADVGLPTMAGLADGFDDAIAAILAAAEDPADDGGVLSQLAAGARTLVRVRPAGPVDGDSRTAIVSRIEAALAAHDLDTAHDEWLDLDAAAREASADWAGRLELRRAADSELAALTAAALAALATENG